MCKELVRLTTEDVSKAITITSSRDVAEKFNKVHKTVIRKIENLMEQNCAVKNMFYESEYISSRGRKEKEYLINIDGFSLLAMGFSGKEALEWKLKYINLFNLMENELKVRKETRVIGVSVRKSLGDTIKNKTDEGTNFKKFAYSNYTKLVYKKILGKTVKKLKEERGLKQKDNLRDFLTIEELEKVQELESKIAFYIEMRKDLTGNDKEIYQEVKKYVDKLD